MSVWPVRTPLNGGNVSLYIAKLFIDSLFCNNTTLDQDKTPLILKCQKFYDSFSSCMISQVTFIAHEKFLLLLVVKIVFLFLAIK